MNKYDGLMFALTFLLIVLLTFCLIGEEKKSQDVNIKKSVPTKTLKGGINE